MHITPSTNRSSMMHSLTPYLAIRATALAYKFLRWDASDSSPILPIATGEETNVDESEAGGCRNNVCVFKLNSDPSHNHYHVLCSSLPCAVLYILKHEAYLFFVSHAGVEFCVQIKVNLFCGY